MSDYHEYAWKNGVTCFAKPVFFPRELIKNNVFVDLKNGEAHRVFSIYKSKEHSREMPEDVVHTFLTKNLSADELVSLRQQSKFANGEPEYVLLPNGA